MKLAPAHIQETLDQLTPLISRGADTTVEAADAAFASLFPYREGAIFVGSFEGDSGWERHQAGDEIVQILKGATDFKILIDDEIQELNLTAGSLLVVPQGCWHRFNAKDQVTVLTVTPQPTDHTFDEDPRDR